MSRAQRDGYRTHTDHELNAYKWRLRDKVAKLADHKEKWYRAGQGWILAEEQNRMVNPNGSWKWHGWEVEAHEYWITVFPEECVKIRDGKPDATGWSQVRKVIDDDKATANTFFKETALPLAMSTDKAEIIKNLKEIVAALDPEELVAQKEKLERDRDSVAALAQDAVNVRVAQDQGQYSERYTELAAEYDRLDGQVKELEQEIVGIEARIRRINEFIRAYKASDEEFSEDGWCTMVEKVTVWRDKMVFTLTTGVEIEV